MFFGLFLAFVATLVIAGLGRLAAVTIMAVGRGLLRTAGNDHPPPPARRTARSGPSELPSTSSPRRLPNRVNAANPPAKPAKPAKARQEGTRPVTGLGCRRRAGRRPRRRARQGGGGPRRQGLGPRTAQPHGPGTGR